MRHREEARARRLAIVASSDSTFRESQHSKARHFRLVCVTKLGGRKFAKVKTFLPSTRGSQSEPRFSPDANSLRHLAPPCNSASRPCPPGAFPGSLAPREPSSRESFRLGVPNGAFHAAVPRTRRGRGPPADSHEALARPRGATRRHRALPVRVAPRLLCSHPARPRTPTDRTSSKKTRLGRTEIPRRRRLPSSRCCLTSAPPSKAAPPPGPRR